MKAVVDNDILLKGACYGLLSQFLSPICLDSEIGVLGAARFVLSKRIERICLKKDSAAVLITLTAFFKQAKILEPTRDELRIASDLEFMAQHLGISLDSGESQLCSILTVRGLPLMLTGDKRAIKSIEKLLRANSELTPICGRIKCLEQVVIAALARWHQESIRSAICAEPEVDKTLTICFGCSSEPVLASNITDGLHSYIEHLRNEAVQVLAP
jgi:hypothetical protein